MELSIFIIYENFQINNYQLARLIYQSNLNITRPQKNEECRSGRAIEINFKHIEGKAAYSSYKYESDQLIALHKRGSKEFKTTVKQQRVSFANNHQSLFPTQNNYYNCSPNSPTLQDELEMDFQQKIHSKEINDISLFNHNGVIIVTLSQDQTFKFFQSITDNSIKQICHLNINQPLPLQWNIYPHNIKELKEKLILALEIVQLLEDNDIRVMALNFLEKIHLSPSFPIIPARMSDTYGTEDIQNWGKSIKNTQKSIKYLDKLKKLRQINEQLQNDSKVFPLIKNEQEDDIGAYLNVNFRQKLKQYTEPEANQTKTQSDFLSRLEQNFNVKQKFIKSPILKKSQTMLFQPGTQSVQKLQSDSIRMKTEESSCTGQFFNYANQKNLLGTTCSSMTKLNSSRQLVGKVLDCMRNKRLKAMKQNRI